MSLYENNIAIVKKRFPGLPAAIDPDVKDMAIEAVETKAGGHVPAVEKEGKKIFVHSRFDPVKEAERFAGDIEMSGHDLVMVFGFGYAYHLEELLKGMGKDAILLVVEKSPAMLASALAYRDLRKLLGDPRFALLVGPDEDSLAAALKGKSSKRCTFITHRGSFQLDPGYYSNQLEVARSYLSTKDVNIATLAKFEKVWSSNLARNIRGFISSPGANIFYGKFSGFPAIVAAAGPSLEQGIDFIRRHRDHAVIIAVDTSYKILIERGIQPHFCVAVDPQVINARYFEGSPLSNTVLVADPTVHPSVFRLFRGPVVTTGIAFDLMKWIERETGEKGEMTHGGSVSTNAYDFARRIGASPIVLVGQDLAFTRGLAHARGSYLDEQVHLRTGRFYSAQMFNRFQLTALPRIMVPGIRSGRVHTNQKMMIFLSWFEKRRDDSLINATYDGALIPNVKHMKMEDISLRDTAEKPEAVIDRLYGHALSEKRKADPSGLKGHVESLLNEIDSLLPALGKAVDFSESLISLMKGKKGDRSKLDYLLKKLSETDRIIESKKKAADMISFSIQKVVHTITEGYDIDGDDGKITDEELVAKRSRYVYQGILEGALFNKKTLGIMAELLEEGL